MISTIIDPQLKAMITWYYVYKIYYLFDGTLNIVKHFVLMADSVTKDTYTHTKMFKQEDDCNFVVVMVKEVEDHENRDYWELFVRKLMLSGSKAIMTLWSFKRKCYPDGRVLKHKARLWAHREMQYWSIDFWETYVPVLNWINVRLLLILLIIHGLNTTSIDIILMFCQAKLEKALFKELPCGFDYGKKGEYALKLKKKLRGICNSANTQFTSNFKILEAEEFVQSNWSTCLPARWLYTNSWGWRKFDQLSGSWHENLFGWNNGIELVVSHWNSIKVSLFRGRANQDVNGPARYHAWSYRQAVGMLTCLQNITDVILQWLRVSVYCFHLIQYCCMKR